MHAIAATERPTAPTKRKGAVDLGNPPPSCAGVSGTQFRVLGARGSRLRLTSGSWAAVFPEDAWTVVSTVSCSKHRTYPSTTCRACQPLGREKVKKISTIGSEYLKQPSSIPLNLVPLAARAWKALLRGLSIYCVLCRTAGPQHIGQQPNIITRRALNFRSLHGPGVPLRYADIQGRLGDWSPCS